MILLIYMPIIFCRFGFKIDVPNGGNATPQKWPTLKNGRNVIEAEAGMAVVLTDLY